MICHRVVVVVVVVDVVVVVVVDVAVVVVVVVVVAVVVKTRTASCSSFSSSCPWGFCPQMTLKLLLLPLLPNPVLAAAVPGVRVVPPAPR